ncbi:MAG: O-acetylhomoserine aminocarboxypropyltransferase/cysteine synthase [Deltaproteobacteria bacterium]|nr:O-acetylhomoserine aminocarboxypropyltransferase/cysteine synthase [Deltaproteobacteria bacterium]MBW2047465.1 O-acetylhomoserine aminocarboxypropyltransferase/cysteine synthase [Deltaproteobacteria bacterium]MBW2352183.1 O-acetylhomoserine aminocarboxypropyltransferase/cysteine synthase [Deltaproteobacteria bacterium]
MSNRYGFNTLALHAGAGVDETNSRGVPLHRTSSYVFKSTTHAADLFALREPGNIYTRIMNPTQGVLEERMAALEGGGGALALASGTAAVFYSVINICGRGDEVVSANNLYGGTYTMFDSILPELGINASLESPLDPANLERAINEHTRMLFTEVIGNPVLDVANIGALSEIAHRYHIPLVVDSTFTTPYLFRPLEHGADVVIHSLTKWLGGHGTGIGGIVVDGGNFDWTDPKFRLFNEPDPSYHGLRYAHDLGELNPLAFITRMRLVPLRNLGACISPDNAWIFLQGIETLPLRMQRHCDNAMGVARYLSDHPAVKWVRYPGLEKDPAHEMASRQFENGFGGMVVFGINGDRTAGEKFIDGLDLISHLANVGDAKTLAIHPASTTHSQLTEDQQLQGGITPDLIRMSVGIESIEDIQGDLAQALDKTK